MEGNADKKKVNFSKSQAKVDEIQKKVDRNCKFWYKNVCKIRQKYTETGKFGLKNGGKCIDKMQFFYDKWSKSRLVNFGKKLRQQEIKSKYYLTYFYQQFCISYKKLKNYRQVIQFYMVLF